MFLLKMSSDRVKRHRHFNFRRSIKNLQQTWRWFGAMHVWFWGESNNSVLPFLVKNYKEVIDFLKVGGQWSTLPASGHIFGWNWSKTEKKFPLTACGAALVTWGQVGWLPASTIVWHAPNPGRPYRVPETLFNTRQTWTAFSTHVT